MKCFSIFRSSKCQSVFEGFSCQNLTLALRCEPMNFYDQESMLIFYLRFKISVNNIKHLFCTESNIPNWELNTFITDFGSFCNILSVYKHAPGVQHEISSSRTISDIWMVCSSVRGRECKNTYASTRLH